jgi:hypothetical protein
LALLKQPLTSMESKQTFDLTVGFYDQAAAGRSSMLKFVLGVYSMNGTFLGF